MVKDIIIQSGLILALAFSIQSCSVGAKSGEPSTITGTIRIVGSEPLTHVILRMNHAEDKNGQHTDYFIKGPLAHELRKNLQGRVVTLEGTACTSPYPQFTKCFKPTDVMVD